MAISDDEAIQQVLAGLAGRLAQIRERVQKPLCACFKFGGYGDFYLLSCIGKAARRKGGGRWHVVLVATCTSATPDVDLCGMVDADTDVVRLPAIDMWLVHSILRRQCEVVYHCPGYAVRRHTIPGFDDAGQAEADAALKPWAKFYFQYPESTYDLDVSQWTVAAQSSALDVTPYDLHPLPLRMLPMRPGEVTASMLVEPTSSNVHKADLRGVGRYVTIHNYGGGGSKTKNLPHATMQALVDAVNAHGLRVVQLGRKHEQRYRNVIDRRGFRWPIQGALIHNSEWYIGLEGGLAYAAWASRTPSLIGTGPTPFAVFGFPNSIPMRPEPLCRPCWWSCADWFKQCPKGYEHCVNFPSPAEAGALIERVLGASERKDKVA